MKLISGAVSQSGLGGKGSLLAALVGQTPGQCRPWPVRCPGLGAWAGSVPGAAGALG